MPNRYNYADGGRIRPSLLQFIYGLRGRRREEVSLKQVLRHFEATPPAMVRKELDDLLTEGYIDIRRTALRRNANCRYVYCLTDKGERTFDFYVRDGACHTG